MTPTPTLPLLFWVGAAALLGAVVGSFLNVVIHRLPKMLERRWYREATAYLAECAGTAKTLPAPSADARVETERFNLAFPASHCPQCHHRLAWWENLPILSWLLLRGHCRHCQQPIPARYLVVEGVTALVTAGIVWHFGLTVVSLCAAGFAWSLIALAFIDWETQLLPDDITLPLLWAGLLVNLEYLFAPLPQAVLGAASGYLLLWSIFWLFKWLTGKEGMGYGDFKLLAALGAWFGAAQLPQILLVSASLGAVIGVVARVRGHLAAGAPIPFGPFLAFAGLITLFWPDLVTRLTF